MTLYQTLGIAESATLDEVKAAYRRIAKENHPDHHPGDRAREERFKAAASAYATLGDPVKRVEYDRALGAQRDAEKRERERQVQERLRQQWAQWMRAQEERQERERQERERQEQARRAREAAEAALRRQQPAAPPPWSGPTVATSGGGEVAAAVGAGLLAFGIGALLAAAFGGGTSWDSSAQRYRGPDGRFRRS